MLAIRNGVPPTKHGYQRLRPNPPPRLGRSSFGRASLTFSGLPSTSLPFRAPMAFSASALLVISTNAKPLGCPLSERDLFEGAHIPSEHSRPAQCPLTWGR